MRATTRPTFQKLLRQLREHRRATGAERRGILRVLRDDEMQDELARRIKAKFGINIDNIRELLALFVEFAPQILALVMQIISMFSSRGAAKKGKP